MQATLRQLLGLLAGDIELCRALLDATFEFITGATDQALLLLFEVADAEGHQRLANHTPVRQAFLRH